MHVIESQVNKKTHKHKHTPASAIQKYSSWMQMQDLSTPSLFSSIFFCISAVMWHWLWEYIVLDFIRAIFTWQVQNASYFERLKTEMMPELLAKTKTIFQCGKKIKCLPWRNWTSTFFSPSLSMMDPFTVFHHILSGVEPWLSHMMLQTLAVMWIYGLGLNQTNRLQSKELNWAAAECLWFSIM